MPLSEHVSRLRLDWGPSLRDHRNDVATTGEGDLAITGSIAVFDGLPTADAGRRSFTSVHKTYGRQLMLAAVWPGQGHFL
jgi:hypothetical protein